MKRFFLSILTLLCMPIMVNAQTETIVAHNLKVTDYNDLDIPLVIITAIGSQYSVDLYLKSTTVCGTYTDENIIPGNCVIWSDSYQGMVSTAGFTIASNDGKYTLKGTVGCEDGRSFSLDLSYQVAGKTRSEELTITDGVYTCQDNYTMAVGFNTDSTAYMTLCTKSNKMEGSFNYSDFYAEQTELTIFENGQTNSFLMLDADITATLDGDVLTYAGTILFQNITDIDDIPEFTIEMVCKPFDDGYEEALKSDESSDFEAHFNEVTYVDADQFDEMAVAYLTAEDDQKGTSMRFFFEKVDEEYTIPEGTYTISEEMGMGTCTASIGAPNGYPYYSYANTYIYDSIEKIWFFREGTVTVTHDGGKLNLAVDARNSRGYSIRITIGNISTGVSGVSDKSAPSDSYRLNDRIIIRDGKKYLHE